MRADRNFEENPRPVVMSGWLVDLLLETAVNSQISKNCSRMTLQYKQVLRRAAEETAPYSSVSTLNDF